MGTRACGLDVTQARVRVRRPEAFPSARLQRRYPGLAVAGLLFFIFTDSEPYIVRRRHGLPHGTQAPPIE